MRANRIRQTCVAMSTLGAFALGSCADDGPNRATVDACERWEELKPRLDTIDRDALWQETTAIQAMASSAALQIDEPEPVEEAAKLLDRFAEDNRFAGDNDELDIIAGEEMDKACRIAL